jgi:hypothetical protein
LNVEGTDLKLSDLSNPMTLWMRMEYWRIAARIGMAHFFTGSGLGTFPTVYPRYQDLDAPPVKAAHNDYLQIFAETGVLGALFFIGFWGYFLMWGLVRIPREPHRGTRWTLVGLYTGLLAFLLHSLVDFNFYNPSLAMTQFVLAGLFLSRTGADDGTRGRRALQQAAVVGLLAVTALSAATTARVHAAYNAIGDDNTANARFGVATALADLDPKTYRAGNQVRLPFSDVALLLPDRRDIERFGAVYVATPGNPPSYRAVPPSEPLAPSTVGRAIVYVRDPAAAREVAMEGVRERVSRLERAHRLYPRNPQVPAEIFRWGEFMRKRAKDKEAQREHVLSMLKWAEEGVRLNPESASFRSYHGNALQLRGTLETDPKRAVQYYREGLEEYRNATERWPISDTLWLQHANALQRYGEAFKKYGLVEEGERYLKESQQALEVVRRIQAEKQG